MINKWLKHYETNVKSKKSDLEQVDKTINGKPVDIKNLQYIHKHVVSFYRHRDNLIDLCCGNGLLTSYFKNDFNKIYGIDLSEDLINIARKKYNFKNIFYICDNVIVLDFLKNFDLNLNSELQFLMYESLQLFDLDDFYKFINSLNSILSNFIIYIGSIPDIDKLKTYYDTDKKYNFYLKSLASGNSHMGKWWSKDEITSILNPINLKFEFIEQNKNVYTSYYRFDLIIKK